MLTADKNKHKRKMEMKRVWNVLPEYVDSHLCRTFHIENGKSTTKPVTEIVKICTLHVPPAATHDSVERKLILAFNCRMDN